MYGFRWRPYVPVHVRRERAKRSLQAMRKKGIEIDPVEIEGRQIAGTFWGQAWCRHLEGFSDYANRLPRGRTYVRNGSVCHLQIQEGIVSALVNGSSLYRVKVHVKKLPRKNWTQLKNQCAGAIGSLLELLEGRLSGSVMEIVTDRNHGLFPRPGEIGLTCSCPDWAMMCKHVAAVLYGVGARLDETPESLFLLRGVNHEELITAGVGQIARQGAGGRGKRGKQRKRLSGEKISNVFGIDLEGGDAPETLAAGRSSARARAKIKPTARARARAKPKVKPKAPVSRRVKGLVQISTGRSVAVLRRKFEMTQVEFAFLLGVGASTVSRWEKKRGKLRLQGDSLAALRGVERLTPVGARRRLRRLQR